MGMHGQDYTIYVESTGAGWKGGRVERWKGGDVEGAIGLRFPRSYGREGGGVVAESRGLRTTKDTESDTQRARSHPAGGSTRPHEVFISSSCLA